MRVEWKRILRAEAMLNKALFIYHFYCVPQQKQNRGNDQEEKKNKTKNWQKEEKDVQLRKFTILRLEQVDMRLIAEFSINENILIQQIFTEALLNICH